MAKQVGPFKFSGRLDDVCGRKTKDGMILQARTGPTREQVLNNDNFINTRRNASEFGGAVDASTLLRRVLGYITKAVKHEKLVSYMNKKLHAVAMSDAQSGWGERCVDKGDLSLLKGFDYNQDLSLDVALPVKLAHSVDMATGQVRLSVPGSLVRHKRVFPVEATHFRIVSCAGSVDFTKQRWSYDIAESALLPLAAVMEALELNHQFIGKPGEVMLHTAGMVFYEVVDGKARLLHGGGVLRVLEVERVANAVVTAVVQGTGTPAHTAKPHTCASVCVAEAMPVLQVAVVGDMVCANCVLEKETVSLLGGRDSEVVASAVVQGTRTPIHIVQPHTYASDEAVDVAFPEADDFILGMVDAKGMILEGVVASDDKKRIQPEKKMRLRMYCKK